MQEIRGNSPRQSDPAFSSELANAKDAAGRVANMLREVEKEIDKLDESVGDSMRIFDSDNDGTISVSELDTCPEELFLKHLRESGDKATSVKYKEKLLKLFREIDQDNDGRITVEEIRNALKRWDQ